jgi:hypothetical protein
MPWFYSWREKINQLTEKKDYQGLLKIFGKMSKDPTLETVEALALVAGDSSTAWANVSKEAENVLDGFITSNRLSRAQVFIALLESGYTWGYLARLLDSSCHLEILSFLKRYSRARTLAALPRQKEVVGWGPVDGEGGLVCFWMTKAAALRIEGASHAIREYLSADFLPSSDAAPAATRPIGEMLADHRQSFARIAIQNRAWDELAFLGEKDAVQRKEQRAATARGIHAIEDRIRIAGRDLLGTATDEGIRRANHELQAGHLIASLTVARLIESMFRSRSRVILLAIQACRGIFASPDLINLLKDISVASETAPAPATSRFQPELVGSGRVGWTSQTALTVRSQASEVLNSLQP